MAWPAAGRAAEPGSAGASSRGPGKPGVHRNDPLGARQPVDRQPSHQRGGVRRAAVGAVQPDAGRWVAEDTRAPPRSSASSIARWTRRQALRSARRLRGAIAQSPMDFERSHHHVEIDQRRGADDLGCHDCGAHADGVADGRDDDREPFTLSVHVRALDRRRERTRLKMRYRRVFAVNRGAEARGRVPGLRPTTPRRKSPRVCCGTWPGSDRAEAVRREHLPDATGAAGRNRTSLRSGRRWTSARRR